MPIGKLWLFFFALEILVNVLYAAVCKSIPKTYDLVFVDLWSITYILLNTLQHHTYACPW